MSTAILFAAPPPPGVGAPLVIGGLTTLKRQVRQVRRTGFTPLIVDRAPFDGSMLDGDVLVLDPGVILDDRIVAALLAATAPAVAIWPGSARGTERIDGRDTAAGIALYPAALVRDVAATLGDWDLGATLLRAALAAGATRVDLTTIPVFDAALGRDVPLVWARPDDPESAARATAALVAAARPGCRDAPQRWLNAPLEDVAVRLLLALPVPADAMMVVGIAVAEAAGVALAVGWLWTGLLLAMLCGPIVGIAAKLARIRIEPTPLGESLVDLAPLGWFVAAAAHFTVTGMPAAWSVAAPLTGFMLADRIQRGFFRRFTGRPLETAGSFERRFALAAARRDTLLWAWLLFAAFGAWTMGFAVLAAYATASFFVGQWRVFKRLGERR